MAMFIVAEVHPFNDGNGRTARLELNCALTEAVVPHHDTDDIRADFLLPFKAP